MQSEGVHGSGIAPKVLCVDFEPHSASTTELSKDLKE